MTLSPCAGFALRMLAAAALASVVGALFAFQEPLSGRLPGWQLALVAMSPSVIALIVSLPSLLLGTLVRAMTVTLCVLPWIPTVHFLVDTSTYTGDDSTGGVIVGIWIASLLLWFVNLTPVALISAAADRVRRFRVQTEPAAEPLSSTGPAAERGP